MGTSLSRLAAAATFVVVAACAGGWPATQAAGSAVDAHVAQKSDPGFDVGRVVETVRRNRLRAAPRAAWHGRPPRTARAPEAGPRGDPPERRFSDRDIPLTGITVGPERPASEPFHVPAIEYQEYPRVARAGNLYLVVWADWRGENSVDVFGSRVTTQGEILDPEGIPISLREDDQYMPTVASDGEGFLVAWEDYYDEGVYGARVTGEGVVQDLDPIRISGANAGGELPSIAWDGTNYLVAWSAWAGDDIYGARVSPGGSVLDETPIQISTAPGVQWAPSLAWNGSEYLVAWESYPAPGVGSDIYAARVTADGDVLDPAGIAISTQTGYEQYSSVASRGDEFLVVWDDERAGPDENVYGSRVAADGTVLDPEGIAISTAGGSEWAPTVASDGTNYFVTWGDARSGYNVYGARVTGGGVVLDTEGIPISTAPDNQYWPGVTWDGLNYFVAWADEREGGDIYGARVTPGGGVLDPNGIVLALSANNQSDVTIARGEDQYLAVWEDDRADVWGPTDVYATRLNSSGQVLDGSGLAVSTNVGSQEKPVAAWNGTNYLVAWNDRGAAASGIRGSRVTSGGQVLDRPALRIGTPPATEVAIGASGDANLVVWVSGGIVHGARVSPSGVVLDPDGIRISPPGDPTAISPAVAWSGSSYLVIWSAGAGPDRNVYGARVSASGVVLDPDGIPIVDAIGAQVEALARLGLVVVSRCLGGQSRTRRRVGSSCRCRRRRARSRRLRRYGNGHQRRLALGLVERRQLPRRARGGLAAADLERARRARPAVRNRARRSCVSHRRVLRLGVRRDVCQWDRHELGRGIHALADGRLVRRAAFPPVRRPRPAACSHAGRLHRLDRDRAGPGARDRRHRQPLRRLRDHDRPAVPRAVLRPELYEPQRELERRRSVPHGQLRVEQRLSAAGPRSRQVDLVALGRPGHRPARHGDLHGSDREPTEPAVRRRMAGRLPPGDGDRELRARPR